MTFLDFEIDEKDLASAKFIGETRRGLIAALLEAKKRDPEICQAQVARLIGMDKGSLSKLLNGKSNITLRKIAEISWALGLEPEVHFCVKHAHRQGRNYSHKVITGAHSSNAQPFSWSPAKRRTGTVKVKGPTQNLRLQNAC